MSCSPRSVSVLILPFQLEFLSFLFILLSLWLRLPILYWIKIMMVSILVLFLVLEKMLSAFHFEYDITCSLVICGLYYVEVYSLYTYFLRSYITNTCLNFSKALFSIFLRLYNFIPQFVNVVYHIDWCLNYLFYWSIVTYNVSLISAIQWSDSVIHICIHCFPYSFPLCFIMRYWIYFSVVYSRTLSFIYYI